ncbi:flagellar motor protein MotB [Lysobacteraceae bacterium NML07-0707]|nr:flagellar motor protein MotB [Xanthomonadaceae bacterium NML07-0707]
MKTCLAVARLRSIPLCRVEEKPMNHNNPAQSHNRNMAGILGAAVLVLASICSPVMAQELNAAKERISGNAIRADHATYENLQGRIKALNDGGIRVDDYHLSKAQCWLDTSFHEYTRNDRGGYPQAALDESARIIRALEGKQDPGNETSLVNDAQRLREDLWVKFTSLKTHAGFSCAAQAVACGEVELVHAGNEIHDGGWRHAKPYIQIAEDHLKKAEERAAACLPPPAPPAPVAPAPTVERFDISADALFRFDRGDLAGLLPAGKTRLDELAANLAGTYVKIDSIRLVGHTDRLGEVEYNQRLSEQRVQTVKQYLQGQGVSAPTEAIGVGESQPSGKTGHCRGERATAALTTCLQPDRRVSVEVTGSKR